MIMSRITIEIAKNVAEKMVSKKTEALNELKAELSNTTYDYITNGLPEKVLEFFKSNPDYVNTNTYFVFNGNGCQNISVSTSPIPVSRNSNYYITPSEEFGTKIEKMHNDINDKIKEIKTLKLSIEEALKSMRTFNKVKELFPEAYEFLPKTKIAFLPSINLDKIREDLC